MTGVTIVSRALRAVGVLASGETASAAEQDDAFNALNMMLNAWEAQNLTLYKQTRVTHTLSASTQSYAIGPAATIACDPAPVWIHEAGLIIDTSASTPTEIPIEVLTRKRQAEIVQKTLTSTLPMAVAYSREQPNGTVTVYPVPSVSTVQLVLYVAQGVPQFDDVEDDVELLPGYAEAVIFQLARRLAPEYGRTLDPQILQLATDAFEIIKRTNINKDELSIDPVLLHRHSRFDIYSGENLR